MDKLLVSKIYNWTFFSIFNALNVCPGSILGKTAPHQEFKTLSGIKIRIFDPIRRDYYRRAITIYQIHSPFLFKFLTEVNLSDLPNTDGLVIDAGKRGTNTLHRFLITTNSSVLIHRGIHQNDEKYQGWIRKVSSRKFNFSIELYNLGLLFSHPVNRQAEHVTFIPWRQKPWKILTI